MTLTCDWRGKVLSQPSRQESSTLSPMVSVLGLLQLPHSAHPVCHQAGVWKLNKHQLITHTNTAPVTFSVQMLNAKCVVTRTGDTTRETES